MKGGSHNKSNAGTSQKSISSFFKKKSSPVGRDGIGEDGADVPKTKRARVAGCNAAVVDPPHPDAPTAAGRADNFESDTLLDPIKTIGPSTVPPRVAQRHQLAHKKLVSSSPPKEENQQDVNKKVTYTPLEQQVIELKKRHPGVLLVIEVGYKMRFFGEDAEVASTVCNIYCYPDHNFLTASVPVHRLPIHVRRLVQAGHKVGIVRQVETAAIKSIGDNKYKPFERKLTALYTSSTLDAGEKADKVGEEGGQVQAQELEGMVGMLEGSTGAGSSYLLCIAEEGPQGGVQKGSVAEAYSDETKVGLVAVESSTGEVLHGTVRSGLAQSDLEAALLALAPSEVVVVEPLTRHTNRVISNYVNATRGCRMERQPSKGYLDDETVALLMTAFQDETVPQMLSTDQQPSSSDPPPSSHHEDDPSVLSFMLGLPPLVLRALAAALQYLTPFELHHLLKVPSAYRPLTGNRELVLGANALRQLEVMTVAGGSQVQGSLLHLVDRTATSFGSRLLRHWVAHPLRDKAAIEYRLAAVQEIKEANEGVLANLPLLLRKLPDLERGITRMYHGTAAPSEVVVVLGALVGLKEKLGVQVNTSGEVQDVEVHSGLLRSLLATAAASEVNSKCQELQGCLHVAAAESNDYINIFMDRKRFVEVFECKDKVVAAEKALKDLLPKLAKTVGVQRLNYVSVQNQGDWLIELPAGRGEVPKDWEKISSTKKVDRYHPKVVKEGILTLSVAKEQLQAGCLNAWSQFLRSFSSCYPACKAAVGALAHLDALQSLANLAQTPGYCRPIFVDDDEPPQIMVTAGRHPVLDVMLNGAAVPNDVHLHWDGERAQVITGPNMGGKSCYIRQTALLCILAQMGSYVPATSMKLHVLDGIYTRMGASDNLLLGRSTFMEELSDAGEVMNQATRRSLVIMDELGRGTATHDGVAIAVASLTYLVNTIGALTLFVTHYPEVATLSHQLPGRIAAYHMAYQRQDGGGIPDEVCSPHDAGISRFTTLVTEGDSASAGGSSPQTEGSLAVNPMSQAGARGSCSTAQPRSDPGPGGVVGSGDGNQQQVDGEDDVMTDVDLTNKCVVKEVDRSGLLSGVLGGTSQLPQARTRPLGRIIFLYKLRRGACNESFGLNVAQMAGLPEEVVDRAAEQAAKLRHKTEFRGSSGTPISRLSDIFRRLAPWLHGEPTGSCEKLLEILRT